MIDKVRLRSFFISSILFVFSSSSSDNSSSSSSSGSDSESSDYEGGLKSVSKMFPQMDHSPAPLSTVDEYSWNLENFYQSEVPSKKPDGRPEGKPHVSTVPISTKLTCNTASSSKSSSDTASKVSVTMSLSNRLYVMVIMNNLAYKLSGAHVKHPIKQRRNVWCFVEPKTNNLWFQFIVSKGL